MEVRKAIFRPVLPQLYGLSLTSGSSISGKARLPNDDEIFPVVDKLKMRHQYWIFNPDNSNILYCVPEDELEIK